MYKELSQQIQDNLIAFLDGMPSEFVDGACQVVVDTIGGYGFAGAPSAATYTVLTEGDNHPATVEVFDNREAAMKTAVTNICSFVERGKWAGDADSGPIVAQFWALVDADNFEGAYAFWQGETDAMRHSELMDQDLSVQIECHEVQI